MKIESVVFCFAITLTRTKPIGMGTIIDFWFASGESFPTSVGSFVHLCSTLNSSKYYIGTFLESLSKKDVEGKEKFWPLANSNFEIEIKSFAQKHRY